VGRFNLHARPWTGSAFRHVPAGVGAQVVDRGHASRSTTNRWNKAGQRTLYLAGDEGVLVAEWVRHFKTALTESLLPLVAGREVYRLDLALGATLDLRDPEVCALLHLDCAPSCFADVEVARAAATFIRAAVGVQGISVPSLAFPDDLDRWSLVLFLENLPEEVSGFVMAVAPAGRLRRN